MTDGPMTQIYFRATADLKALVEAEAKGYDSVSHYLTEVVERALTEPSAGGLNGPVRSPQRPESLDEAADILLRHIPREQAELITDMCADNGNTPKDYLLAYIHLAHERGETATLVSEQLRDDAGRPAPTLAAPVAGQCEFCGATFTAARRGQRFCPDPADATVSCGRLATLRDLHAKRPPDKQSKQHDLAITRGVR